MDVEITETQKQYTKYYIFQNNYKARERKKEIMKEDGRNSSRDMDKILEDIVLGHFWTTSL